MRIIVILHSSAYWYITIYDDSRSGPTIYNAAPVLLVQFVWEGERGGGGWLFPSLHTLIPSYADASTYLLTNN